MVAVPVAAVVVPPIGKPIKSWSNYETSRLPSVNWEFSAKYAIGVPPMDRCSASQIVYDAGFTNPIPTRTMKRVCYASA